MHGATPSGRRSRAAVSVHTLLFCEYTFYTPIVSSCSPLCYATTFAAERDMISTDDAVDGIGSISQPCSPPPPAHHAPRAARAASSHRSSTTKTRTERSWNAPGSRAGGIARARRAGASDGRHATPPRRRRPPPVAVGRVRTRRLLSKKWTDSRGLRPLHPKWTWRTSVRSACRSSRPPLSATSSSASADRTPSAASPSASSTLPT